MIRMIILGLALVFLSGCAAPTLKQNKVSQEAIEEEARIQKKLADDELHKLRERLQRVELKLAPQVRQLCSYLSGGKMGGCYFPVEIDNSPTINAYTDGEKVVFYSGIIRLLDQDEELAVVLGHEYAHAMLLHINKRQSNMLLGLLVDVLIAGATGVDTRGAFSDLGGKAYSKDFELEADYAGIYLAYRAGYDVSQAANVWRKMAIETGSATAKRYSSTHPSSPKRFIAQEQTYAEILNKEIDGQPLLPDKLELVENDEIDPEEYEPEKANNEYKSITRQPKPAPERLIGKYSFAAERHAKSEGCSAESGSVAAGNMVSEEYGTEKYKFECVGAEMLVECEFGNCKTI